MRYLPFGCLCLCLGFSLLACGQQPNAPEREEPVVEQQVPNPMETALMKPTTDAARWNDLLLKVAAEFRGYTKISDDAHWAPTLCRGPLGVDPLKSKTTSSKAHGRKLYFLWVKDSGAYDYEDPDGDLKDQPIGQALVKEAYHPAYPDGDSLALGEPSGLFVMLKFDPSTNGTDAGWIYGTLSADAKTVTSAGLVESCMGCHQDAGPQRLFGPPPTNAPRTPPTEK
ncbi:MAG: cytochrome P460 family protein [Planctomycetes bacterium]|nr:cytochrome P460 family protein [Planctomycetota bacterium]